MWQAATPRQLFFLVAGSELTGSASKTVTRLGHFVHCCWDMREAAAKLPGYKSFPTPHRLKMSHLVQRTS